MATVSQGNLTLNLGSLEQALAKASQITDQSMREMQKRIEEAAKKISGSLSASAAAALQVTTGQFSDFQKAYDPATDAAEKFTKQNVQLTAMLKQNRNAQTAFAKALEESGEPVKQYSDAFDTLRSKGALAAAQVGMGSRQKGLADQLNANDLEYQLARKALEKNAPTPQTDPAYTDKLGLKFPSGNGGSESPGAEEYAKQLDALKTKHSETAQQIQSNYADMTTALGDWRNGASEALDDYMNKAGNVAEQSKTVFAGAFDKMDAAILEFATTGKFNFSDFAKSVLKDMAMLAAKTAASSALSSLFGMASSAVMGWLSPGAGAGAASAADGAGMGWGLGGYTNQLNLSGAGSYSSTKTFANGGAFTNSVATGPTLAPMALFGEAGPEAIMPLSRGSDGSLGVRALGGGQQGSTSSNQVVIQQTINVADGQGAGADVNSQNIAKAYAGSARQGAAEQIARDLKPGGQIWSAINGR